DAGRSAAGCVPRALAIELAGGVAVAQIGAQYTFFHDDVASAGEAFAVVRARARRTLDEGIIHDVDEVARHLGTLATDEIARLAPDGAAHDAAGEPSEDGPGRVGIEDDRHLARRDRFCPELPQGAPRGFFADGLRILELVEEALRRPVIAPALLAALVLSNRND